MSEATEKNRTKLCELVAQLKQLSFPSSPVSVDLVRYVVDSFSAYLDGKQPTLDKAFGLANPRGAPSTSTADHIEIARRTLQIMLDGGSWKAVFDRASAEDWKVKNDRDIRRIYKTHQTLVMSDEIARRLRADEE